MAKQSRAAAQGRRDLGTPSGAPRNTKDGFVLLEPVHTKVFGDHSVIQRPKWNPEGIDEDGKKNGAMYDEAESVEELKNTISYTIPGVGFALDMKNKRHKAIFEHLSHDPNQRGFYEEGHPSQRFRIIDLQKEADTYLASMKSKMIAYSKINQLIETESGQVELVRMGRVFGISGSLNVIQANLMQAIEKPNELTKIMKHLMSEDRVMTEILHAALEIGNAAEEQGFYKSQSGVYYWYKFQCGDTLDKAILWFKEPSNEEAYNQLKNEVIEKER